MNRREGRDQKAIGVSRSLWKNEEEFRVEEEGGERVEGRMS